MKKRTSARQRNRNDRSVLDMTGMQARAFFLKPESYCNVDFPPYFQFRQLLKPVSDLLRQQPLSGMQTKSPRKCEYVCYSTLSNKDGRHAWRPLQLIHPAIYVSLVDAMTSKSHWKDLKDRFAEFRNIPNIKCLSIPVQSLSRQKDKAAQILQWWTGIEQGSIELALDYTYVYHADIADCYGSIYTHSVVWAVHGKGTAKGRQRDESLIGNVIDWRIQDMMYGQTNGIPQGSILMDFVAELVLGYADLELHKRLQHADVSEYRILRYRDDYRIFVNSTQIGEVILKNLTEVMFDLGLKLNTTKTTDAQPVIRSALKSDKLAWIRSRQGDRNLKKHLLLIHAHSNEFTNAGSLVVALADFHERINKLKTIRDPMPLISIVVDIGYHSPRAFPVCAAVVSKLLSFLKSKAAKTDVIERIYRKLSELPNAGHMEVWLQRISHPHKVHPAFNEPLCELVRGKKVTLWNSDWISSPGLKALIDPKKIVNRAKLRALKPVVRPAEIRLFDYY